MNEKQTAAILGLNVDTATFNDATCSLAPVNFFFGKNGTGKSTLAYTLGSRSGIDWNPEQNPDDFEILVYNRDYVEKNLQPFAGLPGVFTVDEVNTSAQKQIEEVTNILSARRTDRAEAKSARDTAEQKQTDLQNAATETFWEKGRQLRERFRAALKGSLTKATYFQNTLATETPMAHSLEALEKLYDTAFDSESIPHAHLDRVTESLPTSSLLGQSIVSTSDSSYARFIKALGATDWVRHGHAEYQPRTNGECPYCRQHLTEEIQQEIASSFDDAYQRDVEALQAFAADYKTRAQVIWKTHRSDQLTDALATLDFSDYDAKIDLLRARLNANAATIDEKLAAPSKPVTLEETTGLIAEINGLIAAFNNAIDEHNRIVESRNDRQKQCKRMVWEAMAELLHDAIGTYRADNAKAERDFEEADQRLKTAETEIGVLEKKIADLRTKTVNTGETVDKINSLLRASGFQGFAMRQRPGEDNVYEVVRSDGSIAEHLSEGERNFIAFLYFYHQLKGSTEREGSPRQKIVVIDDPVSSMDSDSLFIVASLVRGIVDACAQNWNPYGVASDIAQVVVLTHNTYFFKEASYNRVSDYKLVSYFLVEKLDNKSTVRPCIRPRASAPSLMENYTPVTNSYTALWAQYFEVRSSPALLNVMRRVLEHYFIQMCGHDGADLQQTILVDNRDKFVVINEDGTEDLSALHQAQSILSYINHQSTGLGDEIHYIDGAADPTLCRETFKMIFTHMDQSQHYEMMARVHGEERRSGTKGENV